MCDASSTQRGLRTRSGLSGSTARSPRRSMPAPRATMSDHPPRVMPAASVGADDLPMAMVDSAALEPVNPGQYWWMPFVAGVLTILIGIIILVWPGPSLLVV